MKYTLNYCSAAKLTEKKNKSLVHKRISRKYTIHIKFYLLFYNLLNVLYRLLNEWNNSLKCFLRFSGAFIII